jgi:alkyl hydroperoxide reductase subunit F
MLDANIQDQLRAYMERLAAPIELLASLDAGEKSGEMRALLAQVAASSAQITLLEGGGDARTPSFAIGRAGEGARIRFAGLPMGHEFTSLVLGLLQASGYPPRLDAEVIERIRALQGDYRFETYVSLSCQNCPDVVQALNAMAAINPNISHVMIDGALFQDEVERRQVMAVPNVYLTGEPFAQERFGGQVLDTMGIENFISIAHTEGPQLARALEQHVKEYHVDIMNLQRAEALLPAAPGGLHEIRLASGAVLKARAIVLATGARWREMNVPGEQEYRGRGVAYCPHCDGPLFRGKRVAVIGGGNSGIEAAIDLAGIVGHVTVLEFMDTLRADAVLQRKLGSLPNVAVILNAQTTEVSGDGHKVNGIVYTDRASGASHRVDLEGIFVQIGLLPNTDWLKGTVELARSGEIEVDARGQTSVPGVFAAGDATTVPYKQIIIAMGEGSKASLGAFDYLIRNSLPAAA